MIWFRLGSLGVRSAFDLALLRAQLRDAMPTTWFYIKGCPCKAECNANKTSPSTTKVLRWCGKTEQEAVDKCAHHLINSALHKKKKSVAYELAWAAKVDSWEGDTDEDEGEEETFVEGGGAPQTPPRPSKRTRMALSDGAPADTRDPHDPLVDELATRVERLVEQRGRPSSSTVFVQAHSVQHVQSAKEAKSLIADAEEACRKAQGFALSAATAFGDVASKLHKAWLQLD